ncbi:MAG: histidine phosphatase family protein [Polyangiaceae bacterium]|nr:histidine phosphatase family protein [Polyangiaceae bacterium]
MRLLFVRHGQTHDNARSVLQGQRGAGLDDTGRTQIARLGERLKRRSYAAMISSDLQRAAESAGILAERIALEPRLDAAFREIDVGTWSGLTIDEAAARHPEEHAAWRAGKDVRRGGGETYAEVAARMHERALQIARDHRDGVVIVVSHGTAIRALAARVLGLVPNRFPAWPVMTNGAITSFSVERTTMRLLSWNDCAHLEDEPHGI